MKWSHLGFGIFVFYVKVAAVFLAYFGSKIYIHTSRKEIRPHFSRRVVGYLQCIIGLVIFSVLFSAITEDDGDDYHIVGVDSYRFTVLFFTLLIPAIIGAKRGFETNEKLPPTPPSDPNIC